MEELKATVVKTLETNGVLNDVRANLRAIVYKVIDAQDQKIKTDVGFSIQSPKLQMIHQNPLFMVCAEVIREFLQFYQMDYTLQILNPECGLENAQTPKHMLANKVGISNYNATIPILAQLLQPQLNNPNGDQLKASNKESKKDEKKKAKHKKEDSKKKENEMKATEDEPLEPYLTNPKNEEPIKKEAAKKEIPKKEAHKNEGPKKEAHKKEAPKKEAPKEAKEEFTSLKNFPPLLSIQIIRASSKASIGGYSRSREV